MRCYYRQTNRPIRPPFSSRTKSTNLITIFFLRFICTSNQSLQSNMLSVDLVIQATVVKTTTVLRSQPTLKIRRLQVKFVQVVHIDDKYRYSCHFSSTLSDDRSMHTRFHYHWQNSPFFLFLLITWSILVWYDLRRSKFVAIFIHLNDLNGSDMYLFLMNKSVTKIALMIVL